MVWWVSLVSLVSLALEPLWWDSFRNNNVSNLLPVIHILRNSDYQILHRHFSVHNILDRSVQNRMCRHSLSFLSENIYNKVEGATF